MADKQKTWERAEVRAVKAASYVRDRFPVRRVQRWGWAIFRTILMCGLSFVILYPLLYMASMALRPLNQILDPSVIWIPKSFTLDNLKKAVEYMDFSKTLLTTVLITLGGTLLQMASASMAGYGMSRFKFTGRGVLFALLLLSIIVPPQTIILPLSAKYQFFNFLGVGWIYSLITGGTLNLVGSPLSMLIPALFANGIRSGLVIYIFMQFFKGLPVELEDAAYVDGCGPVGTFIRIIMPNSVPVLVTVFTFSIVWYWSDFFYSSMFVPETLTVALKGISSQINASMGTTNPYEIQSIMQAGCLLLVLPLLVVYLFLQRFFVQSVERSGITG